MRFPVRSAMFLDVGLMKLTKRKCMDGKELYIMERKEISQEKIIKFMDSLLSEEKSLATIEKYVRDIEAFRRFSGNAPVDKTLVIRYKQYLMERYAPASTNSMLAALNCFFKKMEWYDCLVKSVRVQQQTFRSMDKVLSRAEYFRLLDTAKRKGNVRLCLLLQTVCSTGIRVSELRFITVDAVKKGRATVSLKGKTRQVLLPRPLCVLLIDYSESQGIGSGSIFITRNGNPMDRSNIFHEMKALCADAGVDSSKVFPHNLRHLFACMYYDTAQDLSRLADILGHSSVNTTRIYTSGSGDEQQRQIESLGLVRAT